MKMLLALTVLATSAPATNVFAVRTSPAAIGKFARIAWNSRVTMTPDGGFLVGNPSARAKLVEYGSLTCPYCERFHQEATSPLRARIATGTVSFEFRPFAVHSADPILHALLLCAGPARYNEFSDDFFNDQVKLTSDYEAWADANPTVDPDKSAADRIRFSDQWGFTTFARAHGLTRARVVACLSNEASIARQRERKNLAKTSLGVQGTPSFLLNDKRIEPNSWPEIDQDISATLS